VFEPLKRSDHLADLPDGFAIGGSHHLGQGKRVPIYLMRYHEDDIHFRMGGMPVLCEPLQSGNCLLGLWKTNASSYTLLSSTSDSHLASLLRRVSAWRVFVLPPIWWIGSLAYQGSQGRCFCSLSFLPDRYLKQSQLCLETCPNSYFTRIFARKRFARSGVFEDSYESQNYRCSLASKAHHLTSRYTLSLRHAQAVLTPTAWLTHLSTNGRG
jgi:hypothetical protein